MPLFDTTEQMCILEEHIEEGQLMCSYATNALASFNSELIVLTLLPKNPPAQAYSTIGENAI